MAPFRQLASVALGLACCMAASVLAQDDTPAPVLLISGAPTDDSAPSPLLISGFENADADALAPVFLPGVGTDATDAGDASENVLLAAGSGSDNSDAPVFLPGVFLDGSSADAAPSTAPSATPAVLLADGDSSAAGDAPVVADNAVLGGWPTMPVGDTEIAFLVSALSDAKLYNPALSFGVCMKDVFKLEYQSVSGTNFRFSGHGCLVHKGSSSMGACSVECAIEQLSVTIFTQEWTNTVEVTGLARLQMTE